LSPKSELGGKFEDGPLKQAIERDFGSVEAFKTKFNTVTAAIQGSGWGWLVCSDDFLVLPSFDNLKGL
jgi:Fe-Mn family superoxide dismutase